MGTVMGSWLINKNFNITTLPIAVKNCNSYQNLAEINYCPEVFYNLLSLNLLA